MVSNCDNFGFVASSESYSNVLNRNGLIIAQSYDV